MKYCTKKPFNLLKYITLLIAFVLLTLPTVSCESPDDGYAWKGYSEKEIKTLYDKNKELFQSMADAVMNSQAFWDHAKRKDDTEHAWIMSPDDQNKMDLFESEKQSAVYDFFHHTLPYMISLDYQRYITITYVTSDQSGSFNFTYYFDQDSINIYGRTYYEDWVASAEETHTHFKVLSDGWFLYYN